MCLLGIQGIHGLWKLNKRTLTCVNTGPHEMEQSSPAYVFYVAIALITLLCKYGVAVSLST